MGARISLAYTYSSSSSSVCSCLMAPITARQCRSASTSFPPPASPCAPRVSHRLSISHFIQQTRTLSPLLWGSSSECKAAMNEGVRLLIVHEGLRKFIPPLSQNTLLKKMGFPFSDSSRNQSRRARIPEQIICTPHASRKALLYSCCALSSPILAPTEALKSPLSAWLCHLGT